MVSNETIMKRIKHLLDANVWDPEDIYLSVQSAFPRVHYSRIRELIHRSKAFGTN